MIFTPTALAGVHTIDVERHSDERGFLGRVFCEQEFAEHGLEMRIVQSSTVQSRHRHTLRGLHFQEAPHGEHKLLRCTRGSIYLALADIRPGSPTRGGWLGMVLTDLSERSVFVPKGLAQGYQTLEDDTEVLYHMSHSYVPDAARGVRWDDPAFGIEWPAAESRIISARDRAWPYLESSTARRSRGAPRRGEPLNS